MLSTAIRFLLFDKAKSIGALLGVVISTFLIGQQAGIFIFLTDSMSTLARLNPEYIWVVDSRTENVNALGQLDMRIGRELESIEGISQVDPLYIGSGIVQFPEGESSAINLIGLSTPNFAGGPRELYEGKLTDLLADGAVCVDIFDKRIFKSTEIGTAFEINKRKSYIAATTKGVRGFGGSYGFTTIERARMYTRASENATSAFLVTVPDPAKRKLVIDRINTTIFGVHAWDGKELSTSSVSVILRTTSIATSIGTLVIFAFISGFFIIGLTLYSAAIDRIKDYGTMKAIGATNGYIVKLIYLQAAIFAVFGFAIGYLFLLGFKAGIANSGLFFSYPPAFIAFLILIVLVIALGGATFAVRRIIKLEPASVFR